MPETPPLSTALQTRLRECSIADERALRRKARRLADAPEQAVAAFNARVDEAVQGNQARRDRLPVPSFDSALPISEHRDEIAAAIRENQVVVICGETGSGKTTQIPKICLGLELGARGFIGHTQPRRIAARSVSARIAEELGIELGTDVGYKIRFNDRVSHDSYIKLMTDGILLAETQGDPDLLRYEAIIIDEAHERSLNIDFLLGYLHKLLPRRPDLKLIITSATFDTGSFSKHFSNAPVIEVSGRSFPVEMRFRPLSGEDEDDKDRGLQQAILDATDELAKHGPGDILVFLSGEREIRETAESLREHHPPGTEILPLYARLSAEEQNRVFKPHKGRRVVLATNVAETALTVPGIRYVIDPGKARISRYSYRSKLQRLPIEVISQASAKQRSGRCGRVAPGVCIRLYSEEDFDARPEYTDPEIRRTNLASVILQMAALKLGDVARFPFIDPPDSRQITDGYKLLQELGAVDSTRNITPVGIELSRLPIDPKLGRMILAARDESCLEEVLIIASGLAVQDPRNRPLDKQQAADEQHRIWRDPKSDFISSLNLWLDWREQNKDLSQNQLRRWCKKHYLAYLRMREWQELRRQLRGILSKSAKSETESASPESIHKALLSGLLGNMGMKQQEGHYLGARGRKFHVHPGSALRKKQPRWVMAAEVVDTGTVFARTCSHIEPEWAESLAPELVKRHYSNPHWAKRSGHVVSSERVMLYGLPIIAARRVNYDRINLPEAREIFIRDALVPGALRTRGRFLAHNAKVVATIEEDAARLRRRDIVNEDQALFEFYDARLPDHICGQTAFETWRKKAEKTKPQLLHASREILLPDAPKSTREQYPAVLAFGPLNLPVRYRFEPGDIDDGVSVDLPVEALNQINDARGEWLVPALLAARMEALLRSLPKALRRHFVPVPDYVPAALERMKSGEGRLIQALTTALKQITGVDIPENAWNPDSLPPHLNMNYRVLDSSGSLLGQGRDIEALRRQLGAAAQSEFAQVVKDSPKENVFTDWTFPDLPEQQNFERNGVTLAGYPALVAKGEGVVVRVFDSAEAAHAEHLNGLLKLIAKRNRDGTKYLQRNLPGFTKLALYFSSLGNQNILRDDLVRAALVQAYALNGELPRNKSEFEACLHKGKAGLMTKANDLVAMVEKVLSTWHSIAKQLDGSLPAHWSDAIADIQQQLSGLVYPGFISQTSPQNLAQLPRYLQAVIQRLSKLEQSPDKDRERCVPIVQISRDYELLVKKTEHHPGLQIELEALRWSIEELRVSQFAQNLKTAGPVSAKRIESALGKIKSKL